MTAAAFAKATAAADAAASSPAWWDPSALSASTSTSTAPPPTSASSASGPPKPPARESRTSLLEHGDLSPSQDAAPDGKAVPAGRPPRGSKRTTTTTAPSSRPPAPAGTSTTARRASDSVLATGVTTARLPALRLEASADDGGAHVRGRSFSDSGTGGPGSRDSDGPSWTRPAGLAATSGSLSARGGSSSQLVGGDRLEGRVFLRGEWRGE